MEDGAGTTARLREFGAMSMDGVGVLRGDEYVYANQTFAEVYGYDEPETLVGTAWQERYEPDDRERIQRAFLSQAHEGDGWWGEVVGRRRDGETVPLELSLRAIGDEQVVCVVREVSERDVRKDDLREENRLLREVIDAFDDILYVVDEEGEPYLWNEALVETTGYAAEEIDTIEPGAFLPERHRDRAPGLFTAIGRSGETTVELDLVTKSGERIPHAFRGTTFEDPETGRIYRYGIARNISQRRQRERELERYETIIQTVEDGIYVIDENLRLSFVNDGFCSLTESSREDLIGRLATDLLVYEDEAAAAEEIRQRVAETDTSVGTVQATLPTAEGERVLEARYRLHPEPDDEIRGSVGIVRDVTEREERERALERQRDELETLNRINDLLFETTRASLGTPTREDLERTVCDRLAASELYQFAWIGTLEPDGATLVPRASAGIDDGNVETMAVPPDETETGQGLVGRSLQTGEVQISQNIRTDPSFEPWREAVLDTDIQSAIAVPLVFGETTYGCLSVCTTRPLGFSRREQAAFQKLGEAVGFTIHAIETRRLLFADAVVELEFRFADVDHFFVRHSERFECDLSVEGYVATKSSGWLLYVGVKGASPRELGEAAADLVDLESVRVVRDGDDDGLIEYRFSESSLLRTLVEAGVKLRSADATAGVCRFVVEAPQDTDTRELVGRIQDIYPGAKVVARREYDRSVAESAVPGGPPGDLTERQRQALETAYRAGYFDWPRRSTAEEIADSMGIAAPTLHRHLRRAEKGLLGAFFDSAESGTDRRR